MSTSILRGNLLKVFAVQVTFNPASVAAATSAEQSVTVNGVLPSDIVMAVNKPSVTAGVGIVNARASAANTVTLTFMNATAGAIDPASEVYTFIIGRAEPPLGAVFNA
jgi:hypothetical protein